MSLIGIHIDNPENINKYNDINFFQFFVSTNKHYKKLKIKSVIHASYTINLAKKWKSSDWWINQLISEIKICEIIGSFAIVIHVGKKLNLTLEESINNIYSSLLYVYENTKKYNVKILLETPAGSGTEILYNIKDFCEFMNKFYTHPNKKIRETFGICIDTCHLFVAGNKINEIIINIDKICGVDKIKLCHLNSSKNNFNSHIDRHENLKNGKINFNELEELAIFLNKLKIPIILETPNKYILDDYKKLKKINYL